MSAHKQPLNGVPEEDVVASGGTNPVLKEDKAESDQILSSRNGENKENVVIKLSDVRKEVQCPICLGIIRKTRTVMECLHRFCRECIEKSMRLGNNECPVCRTHCASRRSLRDDPSYDALIALLYPDIDKYEEEFSSPALGENGHSSQTRVTGENKLDVYLMIVSLDDQSIPSLEMPYLCCKPTLSVRLLCQYVALNTGVQADEVKLFLVKKPQANIINGERPVDPDKDMLLVLGNQETLAELLKTTDNICCGHLVMAYLKVYPPQDDILTQQLPHSPPPSVLDSHDVSVHSSGTNLATADTSTPFTVLDPVLHQEIDEVVADVTVLSHRASNPVENLEYRPLEPNISQASTSQEASE